MKLGLFSVGYAGFWGQASLSLPDVIDRAGRLGYSALMLAGKRPHLSPLDANSHYLEQIQQSLKAAGVTCDAIAGYTNLVAGPAAEVPLGEFQIAYVESLSRIARALGASVVRIFTAYQEPDSDPSALWRRVVAIIREMADRAAAHGVTLAIQNHHDLALDT